MQREFHAWRVAKLGAWPNWTRGTNVAAVYAGRVALVRFFWVKSTVGGGAYATTIGDVFSHAAHSSAGIAFEYFQPWAISQPS